MKLDVKALSKKRILKNISFNLCEGDKIAIVGPNGAGKTTLLKIIMGLENYTSGKIIKEDINCSAVFQSNLLDNELSVMENIKCRLINRQNMDFYLKKISDLGINVQLKYKEISGGQKRIVNFIRAIAMKPNMIILDEMSAGVDINIQGILWNELASFMKNNKSGLIFTTHELEEIRYANRILFLSNGEVKYYGDTNSFINKLPSFKLIVDGKIIQYFNSAKEAINFINIDHSGLIDKDFEIKKVDYKDLFNLI